MAMACLVFCCILFLSFDSAAQVPGLDDCTRAGVADPQIICPPPPAAVDLNSCAAPGGFMPWDYTQKIVYCIENTIINAVVAFLTLLSTYIATILGTVFVLALVLLSIRIMGGEQGITSVVAGFLIRMAIVGTFSINLGGLAVVPFLVLQECLTLVTGGGSPWAQIDAFLGVMFGFGPGLALLNGLLGLVAAMLTTSSVGVYVFFLGLGTILSLLLFVFRAVFCYLQAIMTMGFVIIISPLIVPLGVFQVLEARYVKKWLDMLIASIVQPVLLFAFLWWFLGIFVILISNIFTLLGGNDFTSLWMFNRPAFAWLMPNDPTIAKAFGGMPDGAIIDKIPGFQQFLNSQINTAMNVGTLNLPAVNFGDDQILVLQQLGYQFITLFIFAQMMMALITMITKIAEDITRADLGLGFHNLPFESEARAHFGKMQSKLQEAAAGGGGGGAGGAGGGMGGRAGGGRPGMGGGLPLPFPGGGGGGSPPPPGGRPGGAR